MAERNPSVVYSDVTLACRVLQTLKWENTDPQRTHDIHTLSKSHTDDVQFDQNAVIWCHKPLNWQIMHRNKLGVSKSTWVHVPHWTLERSQFWTWHHGVTHVLARVLGVHKHEGDTSSERPQQTIIMVRSHQVYVKSDMGAVVRRQVHPCTKPTRKNNIKVQLHSLYTSFTTRWHKFTDPTPLSGPKNFKDFVTNSPNWRRV